MDAFYASIEQRDNADLRGKPVIVALKAKRSVVCAASYEARAFEVRSAMRAVRAQRLCPEAVFIPPDFPRYREVSHGVHSILERYTDLIEPLSLDEAYPDVTENKLRLPTATLVARSIREQIRNELHLTASAGVAPNKFLLSALEAHFGRYGRRLQDPHPQSHTKHPSFLLRRVNQHRPAAAGARAPQS